MRFLNGKLEFRNKTIVITAGELEPELKTVKMAKGVHELVEKFLLDVRN